MQFDLVTLEGSKFSEMIYSVTLPTITGPITVLPHHEPLISALVPGVMTIRLKENDTDNKAEHFATYGGVIEVADNVTRVLSDEADHGDKINEEEARRALEEAERMRKEAKTQVELNQAQTLLDRQAVRLQVATMRRRSRHHQE